VLDASGLALCTIGSGGQYLDPARIQETIESNAARARYLAHFGCKHLKVNLSRRVGAENLSRANGKVLARNLNEVGKRTADAGIKFAFHPHAWTLVERQPELDMIMDMTDHRLVYLVLDTGHATLGGIDPVKCLRDYYSRIAAIHLKDAEAMRERHYDGWVTLDFDAPRPGEGTVEQDMTSHKKYLLESLHANLRS
jgi:inosose dehydratase